MSELEQNLSTLKKCFDMEYITEKLYNKYSRHILDDWFKSEINESLALNHVETYNMSELELTENMNELEQRLSTLKRWFDMGYITEELHNEYSRRVLNDWFKRPDDEKPFWKRILDKAISLGHTVLAVLVSIFVRPSQITDE